MKADWAFMRRGRRTLGCVVLALAGLGQAPARAGLFEDDEARKAILELRQRVEGNRQVTDAAINRILDAQREGQTEQMRRINEENGVLRRSLLELQNQIESLRGEVARLTGQGEQTNRELADVQRRQKDLAMGQQEIVKGMEDRVKVAEERVKGAEDRVRQLEPVKVIVDGQEIMVEPAERRAFDAALASFRAGDFVAAQSGILALTARYPKTGYLPSALFWLGNAQYATRDYKEAISNFRILLQAAPEHLRAPEALLAIANCQIELKDLRGARKSLDDLSKAYPQSEAAQAGKERLARLR